MELVKIRVSKATKERLDGMRGKYSADKFINELLSLKQWNDDPLRFHVMKRFAKEDEDDAHKLFDF